GGGSQVAPAQPGEEAGQDAVLHQVARLLPVVEARQGQLVEGVAGLAGGEHERHGEALAGRIDAPLAARRVAQGHAVVVAEQRLGRVAARTARAGEDHGDTGGRPRASAWYYLTSGGPTPGAPENEGALKRS